MSTTTHPKGNPQMATRNPQTDTNRTDTQPTLAAYADDDRARTIRRYTNGENPQEIADALEADLETVARRLRHAGVLEPFDDPRALAHLYHDHDHTLEELADAFGNARGPETIRDRMVTYGIERSEPTLAEKLADPDFGPEDVGLSPSVSDDHAKYTKRGESA